jgi:tripartite-type tricarboxylate transporter receptor subunit TctC
MRVIEQNAAKTFFASCIAITTAVVSSTGSGQAYPTKPVRLLVAFSPGSQTDIVARIIAPKATENWGQQVIVDNRPGGAGGIAGGILTKAAADGRTLMMYSDGHAINAALNPDILPFDPLRDIDRVSLVASLPSILVVAPALRVTSVKDLVVLGKSRPGKLSFGSAGVGGGSHFSAEMFKIAAGIDAVHVPYKGAAEALTETIAGRIQFMFTPPGPALPFIRDGRLLAIAVGSAQRSALLPQVPTVAEAGLPGFEYDLWIGLFAPAGTPRPIVKQLNGEVTRIMNLPDVKERLASQGLVHKAITPEEFDRFVRAEVDKLKNVVRIAGIKPGS